ncbi:MAG: hypothetical protein NVSMB49_29080 [Ktedonobacteraceae bacterium]
MDLLYERHERLLADITALFTTKATSPALERLDGVMSLSIAFLEEQSALLGPVALTEMKETLCGEAANAEQHLSFYLWLHNLFAGLLAEAVEREELTPLDVSFTTDAILASLNPMFYRFQRQERGYSPERILQGLRHIYVEGMKQGECKGLPAS